MFRKVIGVLLLVIGLLGLAFSVVGVIMGQQAVDEIGTVLDNALDRTQDSLDTAADTLVLTKTTFDQVNSGLSTVGETADSVAQTLQDTKPMLDRVADVAAGDIPDGLEAIQEAIPGVAEAAGTIDDTLRTLSAFEVERTIFGIPISFDLGINYDPEVSLDDSVVGIGQSLDGMPDSLRALRTDLDIAGDNLVAISTFVGEIAADLETLGGSVKQIEPLIDDYIQLVADVQQLIEKTQERLNTQLETAKLIVLLLFVWIGINQIIPLYLSWDIFTRNGGKDDQQTDSSIEGVDTEPKAPETVEGSESSVEEPSEE